MFRGHRALVSLGVLDYFHNPTRCYQFTIDHIEILLDLRTETPRSAIKLDFGNHGISIIHNIMKKAKVISLSLPPEMEKDAQRISEEERRSLSEVFREAFRQYMAARDLSDLRKKGKKVAKKMRLSPAKVDKIIYSSRK